MNLMSVTAPASIPSPPADFSSFSLGPLTLHTYALCILAGIILALWMTSVRWKRRGLPEEAVWDIAIWAIPFGIIGGRLYHVVSSPDAYFGADGDLSLIPQIWRGGGACGRRRSRCHGAVGSSPHRRSSAVASIACHMPVKSGIVLAVVATSTTSTPGTRSPMIAANVAIRWSW